MQLLCRAVMVGGICDDVESFFVILTEVTELFIHNTHTYLSRNARTQTHAHAHTLSLLTHFIHVWLASQESDLVFDAHAAPRGRQRRRWRGGRGGVYGSDDSTIRLWDFNRYR